MNDVLVLIFVFIPNIYLFVFPGNFVDDVWLQVCASDVGSVRVRQGQR